MKIPICVHCGSSSIVLRGHRTASGVRQYSWYCLDCKRWAESPPKWLGHQLLRAKLKQQNATLAQVPLLEDDADVQRCVICGAPAETHHWAPEAYRDEFGDDWWKWPTAPLCHKHHRLWHKIVTPELVYHNARRTETEKVR